jgi:quinol monooxygenase YgiN
MNELSVVGILKVREGTESEMRGLLAALVPLSRKDHGNLRYELYQDRHAPRRFVLVQRWADEAAYIKHDKHSAHIQEFQKAHFERIESAEVYQLISVD